LLLAATKHLVEEAELRLCYGREDGEQYDG
jgi:hypothetical protein